MGRQRSGLSGEDVVLKVPVGTQVLEEDQETLIADLDEVGARLQLARGGNGGFGNVHFKGPINQAPRFAMPGQEGQERWLWLRLKLIADAGLVGLPNGGVSGQLDWSFDGFTLTSITAWRDWRNKQIRDGDLRPAPTRACRSRATLSAMSALGLPRASDVARPG